MDTNFSIKCHAGGARRRVQEAAGPCRNSYSFAIAKCMQNRSSSIHRDRTIMIPIPDRNYMQLMNDEYFVFARKPLHSQSLSQN